MSDLSSLFPNLAGALSDWDGRKAAGDGHDDPSHAGVTDDDIERYLTQMGSLRAPLSPVVSGQITPAVPEFANNGRQVPPGQSYMEPPDPAAGQGDAAVVDGEGEEPGVPSEPPPPPADVPEYVEIAGRKYDRRQAEAWAEFNELLQSDPELRALVQSHLQSRGTQPPPQPSPQPLSARVDLPELSDEWRDDSTISGLHRALQQQQENLERISWQAAQAEQIAQRHAQRTYVDIAKGAMSEFQQAHSLDDPTMQAVSRAAASTGFAEKYMQGVDPLTGTPVAPDPYRAVMSALNAGYMMAPETREIEIARIAATRAARREQDDTRKQKLAGVSGASGSVPRTQTVPQSPSDARTALVAEVSQMMNGSWVGDGSN